MDDNASQEQVRRVVGAWIKEQDARLNELMMRRHAIDVEIQQLRQVLEDSTAFARALGLDVPSRPAGGTFTAGSRSSRVPPRRPEFATVPLVVAAAMVLAENLNVPMHADQIVARIFEPGTPVQMRAAKTSVVPALSAGLRERRWDKIGPNTFIMRRSEGE